MEPLKKLINGLGLAGGCIAGIIILPFFVLFLMLRATWRGLHNMTHPNLQIPNPESLFNKPKPQEETTEEIQDV